MSNTTYYQGLADAYRQIIITSEPTNKVHNASKQLADIYESQYGYRRTAGGSVVARDEPDEDEQLRQSDAIRSTMQKRRAAASRERMKSKGSVPTKGGKKLFDEFMLEANAARGVKTKERDHARLKQVYLAARALEYDKWVMFITEMM